MNQLTQVLEKPRHQMEQLMVLLTALTLVVLILVELTLAVQTLVVQTLVELTLVERMIVVQTQVILAEHERGGKEIQVGRESFSR